METSDSNEDKLASEKILDRLREDILKGKYEDGVVVKEQELSEKLGFSRTPVREALSKLEGEDLVDKNVKGGWVIEGLSGQDLGEILYIRRFCEKYVAGKAVENMDPEEKAEMEMTISLMKEFVEKGNMEGAKKWFDEFNQVLIEASGVSHIKNILNRIYKYIDHVAKENLDDPERAKQACKEHEMIAKAIKQGNREEAKAIVDQHVKGVRKKYFSRRKEEDGK